MKKAVNLYAKSCKTADSIEKLVKGSSKESETLANQLSVSAISVCSNLEEGIKIEPNIGAVKFFYLAQRSLQECLYLLRELNKKRGVNKQLLSKVKKEFEKIDYELKQKISGIMELFKK